MISRLILLIGLALPFISGIARTASDGAEIFPGYDIYATTIIREDTVWKQWFAGWLSESDKPWDRIYYSESADSGTTWSDPQQAFTIQNVQVNDPSVLRLWDTINEKYYYRMYYTYYPSGLGDPTNYIATSISDDGLNWIHEGVLIGSDNGIDLDAAWSPSAITVDSIGSVVYLYFHNNHPDGRIFRTTLKNNGSAFDKTTTVTVTTASGLRANPDVSINPDGRWWMYYNGSSLTADNKGNFNTCRMYSEDGVNWKESSNNPIQQNDTMATCTPHVVWRSDTTYELWYGYGKPSFMDFSVYRQFMVNPAEITKTVFASSQALDVMNADKAIDNDRNTFWSSVGYVGSGLHTEWIYFDLGSPTSVSQVNVLPRFVSRSAMCFPVDFRFQSSDDGENWSDIEDQSYTAYQCRDTIEQKFFFGSPVETRYIRLYATKLSADSYGNYYCQVAEINTAALPTGLTGVKPAAGCLLYNYPNPFHSSTTISYSLNTQATVILKVFDLTGKEMATLVQDVQPAGIHHPEWNATDSKGNRLLYGYYVYRLSVNGENFSGKMLFTE
jgi:hypothetical protein